MKGLNSVSIIGNLGNDPEIRYSASGTAIANISIAVNGSVKNSAGDWEEKVEWIRACAFGKTAEVVKDYIHKGDAIHIIGRMQTRSWEKDGVKQYSTEIVINNLIMLGGDSTPGRSREVAPPAPAAPTNHPISEDSLPF